MGWVYDRKKVSPEMIARRVLKSGDGSHFLSHEEAHKNGVYGYGDKDIGKNVIFFFLFNIFFSITPSIPFFRSR
jgi:hypothetical protein